MTLKRIENARLSYIDGGGRGWMEPLRYIERWTRLTESDFTFEFRFPEGNHTIHRTVYASVVGRLAEPDDIAEALPNTGGVPRAPKVAWTLSLSRDFNFTGCRNAEQKQKRIDATVAEIRAALSDETALKAKLVAQVNAEITERVNHLNEEFQREFVRRYTEQPNDEWIATQSAEFVAEQAKLKALYEEREALRRCANAIEDAQAARRNAVMLAYFNKREDEERLLPEPVADQIKIICEKGEAFKTRRSPFH